MSSFEIEARTLRHGATYSIDFEPPYDDARDFDRSPFGPAADPDLIDALDPDVFGYSRIVGGARVFDDDLPRVEVAPGYLFDDVGLGHRRITLEPTPPIRL